MTKQDVQQRNKSTGPEGVGGIGKAGGPGNLVSAGGADEDTSSFSLSSLGIGKAGGPGNLVSAGGADEDTSSFSTSSLGIGKAGGPGSLVSAGAQ